MVWAALTLMVGCRSKPAARADKVFQETSLNQSLVASNDRDWAPQFAIPPYVEIDGDLLHVKDIRNFVYLTEQDFLPDYYDRTFRLSELESVDFIVTPFDGAPLLAHTMLSFGFRGGHYLAASVEARLEKGETYSPMLGAMRQFELTYVLADERDVIRLRTEIRNSRVYVFRSTATPEQARKLLFDVITRVNDLHDYPEFYDTISNNCTTNIVRHVNELNPGAVPYDVKILLPGLSPQLAYDLGLLDRRFTFEELRQRADVTEQAHRYRDSPDFSKKIRR